MIRKNKIGIYSITHVIILLLLMIVCAVAAGGYYFHSQQQKTIMANAAQNQQNSVQIGITDLEERLERLESFIYNFFYNNDDIQTLKYENEEVLRFYAEQNILSVFDQILSLTDPMDCVWIQYPAQNDYHFFARYSNNGILGEDLAEITEYIQKNTEDPGNRVHDSDKWNLGSCGQKYYLFWEIELNNVICGAWVRLSQVFQMLQKNCTSETRLLFYDLQSEKLLYDNGKTVVTPDIGGDETENENICTINSSTKLGLQINTMVPKTAVLLESDTTPFKYIFPLSLGLLVLLFVFLISQILLYRPFQKLANEIQTADIQNSDTPLQTVSYLKEVNTLTDLINSLLQETSRLKTEIYESLVRERDIQCQYLQIRLKSHFYMNCLSIIHSLAQVNNTELIQELAVYLTRYLRFLHDDTARFVSLNDELNHVRNYMHIQELRFPGLFHYIEDVDISLLDCMIPPILIETFVENSVEHGMKLESDNWVKLTARFQMKEETPGIDFIIEDNGCGFKQEELETLQQLKQLNVSSQDQFYLSSGGIGIQNVVSRLQIIYYGKAECYFRNKEEGGAMVRLFIPMDVSDSEDSETEEI